MGLLRVVCVMGEGWFGVDLRGCEVEFLWIWYGGVMCCAGVGLLCKKGEKYALMIFQSVSKKTT